ncbi:MAG: hypothetical protein DWH97_05485 [Planctomycetota bacterium]|nr:MAG: hypothetical protein DWH97_05485 [Planctomycetota bacterium]RLS96991.1 MAG: hypothetical protein DWI12_00730 [Planctomycetota bacterium]
MCFARTSDSITNGINIKGCKPRGSLRAVLRCDWSVPWNSHAPLLRRRCGHDRSTRLRGQLAPSVRIFRIDHCADFAVRNDSMPMRLLR